MFARKPAFVAVLTVAVVLGSATVVILARANGQVEPSTPAQINPLELMSNARDLPVQSIENPV